MTWTDWFCAPGFDVHPAVYMAVAVLAVMLVAVSKGGFGGGVGALSVPLLLQTVPEDGAGVIVGMWLPVLVVCDICTLPHYPRQWRPSALFRLVPGMFAGLAVGFFLLGPVGDHGWLLSLGIGVISLFFVVLWAVRHWFNRRVEERPPWRPSWLAGTFVGVTAGVSTMLAHAAGSIIQMFVLPQKLEKREFVGTCARYFFVFNAIKLPLFIFSSSKAQLTWPAFRSSLWLFALAPLGVWLGSWLNRRVSPVWFVRLVYLFLGVAGVKLIVDAIQTMIGD
jgi:hypothetical protein